LTPERRAGRIALHFLEQGAEMKRIASIAAMVVVVVGSALLAQKSDPAIEKIGQQYEAGFNKGDAKALAALHTADALRVTPDGRLLTGRAAIEKDLVASFTGPFKGTTLTLQQGRTQMLSPDIALLEGTYQVTGGTAPVKGRYLNTAKREGGQWLLASVVTVNEASPK
jgi:uncharacterized protein (TIGR02246 family)